MPFCNPGFKKNKRIGINNSSLKNTAGHMAWQIHRHTADIASPSP